MNLSDKLQKLCSKFEIEDFYMKTWVNMEHSSTIKDDAFLANILNILLRKMEEFENRLLKLENEVCK